VVNEAETRIRELGPGDLSRALELSTEAHWNQTTRDWQFFLDHAYVYGLERGDVGIVGTTVAWDLPPDTSWIAMVLVDKAWRGQGYARRLMQHAIDGAETRGLAAALDATHLGEPVYLRMGFGGEEKVARLFAAEPQMALDDFSCFRLQEVMLAEAAELDARRTGFQRAAMVQDRFHRLPKAAWGHRDGASRLDGMVVGREGRVAGQIGPLFAEDSVMARSLLAAALTDWEGPAFIDVPIRQTDFCDYLSGCGFTVEREFKRMTRPPNAGSSDWTRTFAIAGPDFA